MASVLKTEAIVVLGIGLAAVYLATRAGKAIIGTAADALPYINPADSRNIVNTAANDLWQWASGSNQTIGADVYDYVHKGDPLPGAVRDPATGITPAYNYTQAQQEADLRAIRQLEAGYHGM